MCEGLSAERACKILDHQWLTGDVSYCCVLYQLSTQIGIVHLHYFQVINVYSSYLLGVVGDDRHIMPTWLVNWLLEFRPVTEPGKNENEVMAKKNGPVNRCTDEYFKKDKVSLTGLMYAYMRYK